MSLTLRVCLVVLALAATACDDPGTSRTVSSTGDGPTTLTNLSGSWSGSANDSLRQTIMTWQLSQTGGQVTGTVTSTTTLGAPVFTGGSVTGSLSGTTLTFNVSIPRGRIVDLPDCTVTMSGSTTDITGNGMTGIYAGTDSCAGPFVGGRFTFVKQ